MRSVEPVRTHHDMGAYRSEFTHLSPLPCVLFVDDDAHQRSGLQRTLRGHANVRLAASAAEALRCLQDDDTLEVVVSDLKMPGTDGAELLQQVREFDPTIPGILLSGHADLESAIAVINQGGVFRFLTKPCPPEVLRDAIGSAARIHRHRREQLRSCLAELEEMREEALLASRSRSRFLAQLAHELHTPLTAMIGFADLLRRSELPTGDRTAVERILDAGQHLQGLINDLGEIGCLTEITVATEDVELAAVVGDAIELVRVVAEQRSVRLPDPAGLQGLTVRADRTRLRQVVVNLLTNAIKYNRPGGRISVRGHRAQHNVAFDVTDTGHGIAADRLDRVFVPFDRLGAEEGSIAGVGIGLAIVRDLTEAMGGTVRVLTSSKDGTTFRVVLPAANH